MKIKKIYAPSMAEAMEKIKKELGQDAVILNSKVLYSGGFLGFFKKKSFEVLAAIDPQPMANKQQPNKKEKIKIKFKNKMEKLQQKQNNEQEISDSLVDTNTLLNMDSNKKEE